VATRRSVGPTVSNTGMGLTDGEVGALATHVAGVITAWLPDNQRVDVRISPTGGDDPYRWSDAGAGWTVYFDVGPGRDDTIAIRLSVEDSPGWALFRLVDGLDELSETERYRGVAFPACAPGHRHPARVALDGADVVLRCPQTGELVQRICAALP
jgi:hypothetical protein